MKVLKIILIILFVLVLVSIAFYIINKLRVEEPEINQKFITEYVVATKANDDFYDLAKYFAEKKNAEIITFKNVDDMVSQLQKFSPTYLAIVLSPQELTPDFVDEVDEKLRTLDNDPFFDVAYGIITSFTANEGYEYVNRLLNYKTPEDISVYGVNQGERFKNLKNYGFSVFDRCLDIGAVGICDEESKITVDRMNKEAKNYDLVNFFVHGSPNEMELGSLERLEGNKNGLIGTKPTDEEICYKDEEGGTTTCGPKMENVSINLNAVLVTAFSCTTARINGKPSIIQEEYNDDGAEGKVDTSLVLSFLKSGALNYIGSTHVANSAVFPDETIVDESILQGMPIGIAMKNFKNNYILNKVYQNKILEAKPRSNDHTIGFTEFQIRNWVLFGDPSIKLSNKKITPENCIKEYRETLTDRNKNVGVEIKFTDENGNSLANSKLIGESIKGKGIVTEQLGAMACVIHIPLERELISWEISYERIDERFSSYFREGGIIENSGDELTMLIPDFIVKYGETAKLNFKIKLKK